MKNYAIAMALAVVSFNAAADYYGGNDIAEWSDSRTKIKAGNADVTDFVNAGILRGLSVGVHDAFEGTSVCTPKGATNGQIVDTVVVYIANHPERRAENASRLAYEALSSAYPCKK